jgi:hypothetical protein
LWRLTIVAACAFELSFWQSYGLVPPIRACDDGRGVVAYAWSVLVTT